MFKNVLVTTLFVLGTCTYANAFHLEKFSAPPSVDNSVTTAECLCVDGTYSEPACAGCQDRAFCRRPDGSPSFTEDGGLTLCLLNREKDELGSCAACRGEVDENGQSLCYSGVRCRLQPADDCAPDELCDTINSDDFFVHGVTGGGGYSNQHCEDGCVA